MQQLVGKTIAEVLVGEEDVWDEAILLKMTDGTMFYIQAGSSSSMGILSIEEVTSIPESFKTK